MSKNKSKSLNQIWQQVPPDYYHRGVKNNPLQWLWHTLKFRSFTKLTAPYQFKKILDLGCAGGYMTNKIAQIFPQSQVWGVDVYPQAIAYAQNLFPNIHFQVADAHNLPFKKDSFDLIVCYETVEHVSDPQKILQEMRRIITKKGVVLVAMDSGNTLFNIIWLIWEKTFGKVWQDAHLHPFHHHDLEEIVKLAGFQILSKHFSHFGMEVSFVLQK